MMQYVQPKVAVRRQDNLVVLHRINLHILVDYLLINKDLLEPYSSYCRQFTFDVFLGEPVEFANVLHLAHCLYELGCYFINTTNYVSRKHLFLLSLFVNTFLWFLYAELGKQSLFPFKYITSAVSSEFSGAINKPRDFTRRKIALIVCTVRELYVHHTHITSNSAVNSNICKSIEVAMQDELVAFHKIGTNWRMMTYLLIIDWYPFYVSLECLSKNRIERFLHDQLQCRQRGNKSHNILNLFQWCLIGQRTQIVRCQSKRRNSSFQQAP